MVISKGRERESQSFFWDDNQKKKYLRSGVTAYNTHILRSLPNIANPLSYETIL